MSILMYSAFGFFVDFKFFSTLDSFGVENVKKELLNKVKENSQAHD